MKGQGRNDDAKSRNGPGNFIAAKVRASSQVAVHATFSSNIQASVGQNTANATNTTAPISSIGLSEISKLSEKEVQV